MFCYIEYQVGYETRFFYYDKNKYKYEEISGFIEHQVVPSDCLDVSYTQHKFIQSMLDNAQKLAYYQGMSVMTMLNPNKINKNKGENNNENSSK